LFVCFFFYPILVQTLQARVKPPLNVRQLIRLYPAPTIGLSHSLSPPLSLALTLSLSLSLLPNSSQLASSAQILIVVLSYSRRGQLLATWTWPDECGRRYLVHERLRRTQAHIRTTQDAMQPQPTATTRTRRVRVRRRQRTNSRNAKEGDSMRDRGNFDRLCRFAEFDAPRDRDGPARDELSKLSNASRVRSSRTCVLCILRIYGRLVFSSTLLTHDFRFRDAFP